MPCRHAIPLLCSAVIAGCSASDDGSDGSNSDLTGTTSAERAIHFEGQVFVAPDANDDAIRTAVAREVKTAIGALRQPMVSINDRAAHENLAQTKWTKRTV